jgi:large conductance mechanosensitive channel
MRRMKKIIQEFKEFAVKGNVMDLAIGLVIGAAFQKIVNSLVNDIIMPPVSAITGSVNFADLYINLSGQDVTSIADAKAKGLPVLAYGAFLNVVLEFLIVAWAMFFIVKMMNRLRRAQERKEEKAEEKKK